MIGILGFTNERVCVHGRRIDFGIKNIGVRKERFSRLPGHLGDLGNKISLAGSSY